ncbi:F0F1 ATP synthase subunit A [Gelidibacter salicanalis]|uniref:ATP synthase subunit a n=1 Tax=Gelidibacter salicanalis TaxID=291193 RepID=A0A934KPE2_9FLAO|nr:F0F1 ATP synthase subunit A [Gelidibacter salicanalis]MBJ7879695.1 F0F1 ATP synthase subunit A [Gelidibacter salicanalis]
MTLNTLRAVLFLVFSVAITNFGFAAQDNEDQDKGFNATEMIMHHVKDAHEFHIVDWDNKPISIPLPIILFTDNGLTTFMSSEFHHDDSGSTIVEKNGERFVKYHEKIYQLEPGVNTLTFDEELHPNNAATPLDFSITKNVFMMWVSVILLFIIFISAARKYSKSNNNIPRGVASYVEPLVVFIRDEVAIPMIGENKYKRYMPFLLTVFFFIWINNIFGLIPILNGANVSGNIAFTLSLALFTFFIVMFNGNKNYWKHIFWMPGVPVPMKLFLMPIEIIGMFVKPFSLTIRLFANITAGHIIILSLMSLIFTFQSVAIAPVSVGFSLFILIIEIVVVAIQAYIFTVLSALYIGMATAEDHH